MSRALPLPLLGLLACGDAPETVASVAADMGQLPSGIAAIGDDVLVALAPRGEVLRVAPDGKTSAFGQLPFSVPANGGLLRGLAADGQGRLYAAFTALGPPLTSGIFRFPAGGGVAEPFASDPAMAAPSNLAFDRGGRLLVSDTGGTLFSVAADGGAVRVLSQHKLLRGGGPCPGALLSVAQGASGLALGQGVLYVTIPDRGALLRVPINDAGEAGAPEELLSDCNVLVRPEGLVQDRQGTLVVAIPGASRVMRVDPESREAWLVDDGNRLDYPVGLALSAAGTRRIFVTSGAFLSNQAPAGQPRPSLVAIPWGD